MHPIHKRSTSTFAEWGGQSREAVEGGQMASFAECRESQEPLRRSTPLADQRLLDRLLRALAAAPHLDVASVVVIVAEGIVRLIGEVRDREDRRAVQDVVAHVGGVSVIRNDLSHRKDRLAPA